MVTMIFKVKRLKLLETYIAAPPPLAFFRNNRGQQLSRQRLEVLSFLQSQIFYIAIRDGKVFKVYT